MRWGDYLLIPGTLDLARQYKHICCFGKYTDFVDVGLFCKKSAFFRQDIAVTQSNRVRATLEIF